MGDFQLLSALREVRTEAERRGRAERWGELHDEADALLRSLTAEDRLDELPAADDGIGGRYLRDRLPADLDTEQLAVELNALADDPSGERLGAVHGRLRDLRRSIES